MGQAQKSTGQHPLTVTLAALIDKNGDETFRDLLHGLLALTARLEAIRENVGSVLGISGVQYTMLMSIFHLEEKGAVFISSIAEHLHLSGAFVTIETGKLTRKGVITKSKDSTDGRRVRVRITPRTRRHLVELADIQRQINDQLFVDFGRQDFRGLSRGISKLVNNCDAAVRLSSYLSDSTLSKGT